MRASSRKRSTSLETEKGPDEEWEEYENELELLNSIHERIGLKHPIIYDTFNLCKYAAKGRLSKLNNTILKEILDCYEIAFTSKEKKTRLCNKDRRNGERKRVQVSGLIAIDFLYELSILSYVTCKRGDKRQACCLSRNAMSKYCKGQTFNFLQIPLTYKACL